MFSHLNCKYSPASKTDRKVYLNGELKFIGGTAEAKQTSHSTLLM